MPCNSKRTLSSGFDKYIIYHYMIYISFLPGREGSRAQSYAYPLRSLIHACRCENEPEFFLRHARLRNLSRPLLSRAWLRFTCAQKVNENTFRPNGFRPFVVCILLVRAQLKKQPQRKMSGCLDFSSVAFATREPIKEFLNL